MDGQTGLIRNQNIKDFYNQTSYKYDFWKNKNRYYHRKLEQFYRFVIPEGKRVLELGSGTGNLLSAVKPSNGVGVDISENMVEIARDKYPGLQFIEGDVQNHLNVQEPFDYIILSDLLSDLEDIQKTFTELQKVVDKNTRIVINSFSYVWTPILNIAQKLGLKMPHPSQNWLSMEDIENLLLLAGFDVIKKDRFMLLPVYIPLLSTLINKYVARLPLLRKLGLVQYFIVRKIPEDNGQEYSVSVVIPARNEKGNIEKAVQSVPEMGSHTQIIFVEGGSKDGTYEEIVRVAEKYSGQRDIVYLKQDTGVGKGDAVRKGFAQAQGDILMILDADLTVEPSELLKFYEAIRSHKGEYINGSRLVYPMENEAMRFLNVLGNKFFSICFSWILNQPIKDTLCGTKVLFRKDYENLANNRSYFGNFDPFGDFDLILGASKLNLKMVEVPVRYKARTYGSTNISRFSHGWLLLKMTIFAARKLKFF